MRFAAKKILAKRVTSIGRVLHTASKAASDHVARVGQGHVLPILITHCTNNYGSFHREKFIPVVIDRLLNGQEFQLMVMENRFEI